MATFHELCPEASAGVKRIPVEVGLAGLARGGWRWEIEECMVRRAERYPCHWNMGRKKRGGEE